jgi:hypothetical protein
METTFIRIIPKEAVQLRFSTSMWKIYNYIVNHSKRKQFLAKIIIREKDVSSRTAVFVDGYRITIKTIRR